MDPFQNLFLRKNSPILLEQEMETLIVGLRLIFLITGGKVRFFHQPSDGLFFIVWHFSVI